MWWQHASPPLQPTDSCRPAERELLSSGPSRPHLPSSAPPHNFFLFLTLQRVQNCCTYVPLLLPGHHSHETGQPTDSQLTAAGQRSASYSVFRPKPASPAKQCATSQFFLVLDPLKGPELLHLRAPAAAWPPLEHETGQPTDSPLTAAGQRSASYFLQAQAGLTCQAVRHLTIFSCS